MFQLFLILLTGSFTGPASEATGMCTYGITWFPMRGESNDFYLARATGDSVFVRDLYSAREGLFTTPQSAHDKKISVYGQIAEVIQPGYDAFLLWANDNPQIARKYPACAMLHVSEMNLLREQDRQTRPPCR